MVVSLTRAGSWPVPSYTARANWAQLMPPAGVRHVVGAVFRAREEQVQSSSCQILG